MILVRGFGRTVSHSGWQKPRPTKAGRAARPLLDKNASAGSAFNSFVLGGFLNLFISITNLHPFGTGPN